MALLSAAPVFETLTFESTITKKKTDFMGEYLKQQT